MDINEEVIHTHTHTHSHTCYMLFGPYKDTHIFWRFLPEVNCDLFTNHQLLPSLTEKKKKILQKNKASHSWLNTFWWFLCRISLRRKHQSQWDSLLHISESDPVSQYQQPFKPPLFSLHVLPLFLVALFSCQFAVKGQRLWARCLLRQLPERPHTDWANVCRCGLSAQAQLQMFQTAGLLDQSVLLFSNPLHQCTIFSHF